MKAFTTGVAAALCGLSLLSTATAADRPRDPQVATAETQAESEARRWENSFSRDPYPAMGVGTTHGLQPTWRPKPRDELAGWENGLGRDPHPGMGVGQGHAR